MEKATMPSHNDKGAIRFGLFIVISVFFIIGGWMAYAPLDAASVAIGTVSADMEKKTLQHLEGGIVDEILVKDGDEVQKDQVLLRFKDTQVKAQLDILENQYFESLAQEARLISQRDDLDIFKYTKELEKFATIEAVQNSIAAQKQVFTLRQKLIKNDELITSQRIAQLENQIDGANSIIQSKKSRLISLDEELKELNELFKEQLIDKLRLREVQREKTQIEGDISNTNSHIGQLREQISELKSQELLRKKDFQDKVLAELVETTTKISDLRSKIEAIKDTVKRLDVVAPSAGIVFGMNIYTVGAVIAPGKPIFDIVPKDSRLIVNAKLNTSDIDRVKPGFMCDIRFSAFDLRQTHVIEGVVEHVSADIFVDEASKMPYYQTKIAVTKTGEEMLKGYGFKLLPGMPAEVMIKLEKRTVLDYLVKPFGDMLSRSFKEE